MKTDKELYKLFSSCPELLFEITHSKPSDTYKMVSITLKEFERRTDGFLEPKSNKSPVYFVEFQGYMDDSIYHRLIMEMAAYGVENPQREIRGILVFTHDQLDKKTLPWHTLTQHKNQMFQVVYLENYLNELEKKDPNHPLVATFKPYRINDKQILKKNAKSWYRRIKQSALPEPVKDTFESIFTRWMQERFVNYSYKEVTEMFVELTPLEKTRSYKELVAIGKKKGEKIGEKRGQKVGEKRGEKRGQKIGEQKATQRLIARLVANKFKINIQRVAPRLRSLRTKDIIELGDHILSMNSYEDAFQWIDDRKKKIKMA